MPTIVAGDLGQPSMQSSSVPRLYELAGRSAKVARTVRPRS
jgi:hypothetical protein